jgi:hypothetical protein
MEPLNVLIACEESQTVCIEFRKLGHEAFSCDILSCSGGHPEWHIKEDILKVLAGSFQQYGQFWTEAETVEPPIKWDLMIAHPECTRLTCAANKYYKPKYRKRFPLILEERESAVHFFMSLAKADIEHIAIENPIGIMSTRWRKPDQIIQPYFFGDTERKGTCLWLKNLPKLIHSKEETLFENKTHVEPDLVYYKNGGTDSRLHYETLGLPKEERRKARSKTFNGLAHAMATQWSEYLINLAK